MDRGSQGEGLGREPDYVRGRGRREGRREKGKGWGGEGTESK